MQHPGYPQARGCGETRASGNPTEARVRGARDLEAPEAVGRRPRPLDGLAADHRGNDRRVGRVSTREPLDAAIAPEALAQRRLVEVDAGVAVALATDLNPGSAPCLSMPLTMALACRYGRLLPAEALNASTINAAYAVGLGDRIGSIQLGKQADFLILDAPDYRHLAYWLGGNPVEQVIKRGRVVRGGDPLKN